MAILQAHVFMKSRDVGVLVAELPQRMAIVMWGRKKEYTMTIIIRESKFRVFQHLWKKVYDDI